MLREADSAITAPPASQPARRHSSPLRAVAISVAYLLVYLALDYVSARFNARLDEPLISPWYLPQGLTLGLLVLGGLIYLPVVFIAKLISGLICWHAGSATSVGMALALVIGYGLAALLLRRVLRLDPRLVRLRDAFSLVLVALLAPLLAGVLAAIGLVLTGAGSWGQFGDIVTHWWNGDLIGLLGVAPFLMVHGAPWARALFSRGAHAATGETLVEREEEGEALPRPTLRGVASALLWAVIIAAVIWLAMLSPAEVREYRLFYLAFLVIIWIALQHGMRGATAGVLAFSLGTLAAFFYDVGNAAEMMAALQIYILTLALTGLLMGAVVSERWRTEQTVRASEDLLRTLINAMPDLVIFKDGEGRWLTANDFGLRLFQLAPEGYRGKTDAELAEGNAFFSDALQDAQRADGQAWREGAAVRGEQVIPQPDGRQMTFDVIRVPLLHPGGRRKGLVVIGRDITERKQAEEALDKERAYLSSAIDILPLPLAFLSPTGEWTQANAASYGFVPGLLPRQWLDGQMLTPDTRTLIPRQARPFMRSLENGEVLTSMEVTLILPDGREVPILVHSGPVSVGGRLVAVVAAFQDITAIKEADRAKDEFLGILSHELLTPLTDALGWTQAARETPDSAAQALDIIEHNVRLLHRVMTDLLDLSRIIHGKLYLAREVSDLWKLVERHARDFEPVASGRRRTLVLEAPDEPMPVSLDRDRLQQVLATLLDNALKGTNPGDRIIVTGRCEGDTAVLVVRDTGRGLEPDTIAHLFTPFHQSQPIEPGRGMGLGLALVKGLIELHGGRLTADSPGLNAGSIFTIELPLRMDD